MTAMLDVSGSITRPWTEEIVDVDDLDIDRSYQRAPIEGHIREMAKKYDMVLANYVYVNRRTNGALFLIDGQQRWMAARKAGEREMFAIVVEGLTQKQEAELYYELNRQRRPLTSVDKFKGGFAAGNPEARQIHKLVKSFGGGVRGIDHGRDPIMAVAALQHIFSRGGHIGLSTVLGIIRDSWGDISNTACQSHTLKGLYLLISNHPDADRERIVARLAEVGHLGLRQKAHAFGMAAGSVNEFTYYLALIDTYNSRLKSKRIEPKAKSQRTEHVRAHLKQSGDE